MTIGSLQSNPWTNPWAASIASQSASQTAWNDVTGVSAGASGQAAAGGPWFNPGTSASGNASAPPPNPLQALASDIQAMLIQAQTAIAPGSGGGTSTTATTGTTGTTDTTGTTGVTATASSTGTDGATAPTLEQNLANDIQTLLSDLQAAATPATQAPGTQTANTDPTGGVGQAEHHHHHHHHHPHEDGGELNGATDVAGNTASSGATPAAARSTASNDQAVSRIFAADIAQALQAYAGGSAATTG